MSPPSLALVGLGPRGLHALERLLLLWQRSPPSRPVRVDLFEPHPFPGAGPQYDPRQPTFLRMNFASRYVDLWSRDLEGGDAARPSLVAWLAAHAPEGSDSDAFAPRALVGRYLHDGFEWLLAGPHPPGVTVRLVPEAVTSLEPSGQGWTLETASGALGTNVFGPYAEVLVATGHSSSRRDGFGARWAGRGPELGVRFVGSVFPLGIDGAGPDLLDPSLVSAGSVVAVRGFALTFIDAALALTEGRGGTFSGDLLDLAYRPSPQDAGRILPFSRSGRPLLAKPDPRRLCLAVSPEELEGVWEHGRGQLQEIFAEAEIEVLRDLGPLFGETAGAALARARPELSPSEAAERTCAELARWLELPGSSALPGAEALLRRSLEVSQGHRWVDERWALGEAWRRLYPALVAAVSHGGLPPSAWPAFSRLAAEMERLAFGPPAVNVAKLLALGRAGVLDLSRASSPRQGPALIEAGGRLHLVGLDGTLGPPLDALVDAVLPAPGCDKGSPLLGPLLDRGILSLARTEDGPGPWGLRTSPSAQALSPSGRPVPGLSVLGRAVEGWVLGHDTLSRSLHGELPRWAARVAAWTTGHRLP